MTRVETGSKAALFSTPLLVGGRLFLASHSGRLSCFLRSGAGDWAEEWQQQLHSPLAASPSLLSDQGSASNSS